MINTCVCGYIHESGFGEDNQWSPYLQGDKEFLKLEGTYIVNDDRYDETKVKLIACPKCFTVKVEEKY